jgi:hypothetical protein
LQLAAARNLSIVSAAQSVQSASSTLEQSSGFAANYASGVASIGYSKSSTATQGNLATVTQQG